MTALDIVKKHAKDLPTLHGTIKFNPIAAWVVDLYDHGIIGQNDIYGKCLDLLDNGIPVYGSYEWCEVYGKLVFVP